MKAKKLFIQIVCLLVTVVLGLVIFNGFQIRNSAKQYLTNLRIQHCDATYEIYKNEIMSNILIGNVNIQQTLLNEISQYRDIGLSLSYNGKTLRAGQVTQKMPTKSYTLDLGKQSFATLNLYAFDGGNIPWNASALTLLFLLEVIGIVVLFTYLWFCVNRRLLNPLKALGCNLTPSGLAHHSLPAYALSELHNLNETLKVLHASIKQTAQLEAEVKTAKQVGHDIRSPLACLTLLLSQLPELIEEKRHLMRSAISRINDIANDLYSKSQTESTITETQVLQPHMLSSVVDSIVSEKRMQIRNRQNIKINLCLDASYGLFANMNAAYFKRALSNIINNSIDACDDNAHEIIINVTGQQDSISVIIHDDGIGIPANILPQIKEYGFSYGKEAMTEGGDGLGLYHAYSAVTRFGGNILIESPPGQGTTVKIILPRGEVPSWFVEKIVIRAEQHILILDDDQSIHDLWRNRLDKFLSIGVRLSFFSCADKLEHCVNNLLPHHVKNSLLLCDFELVNQAISGLALIEKLHYADKSILVTSHYEDPDIQIQAQRLCIPLIPKSIAAFVPLYDYRYTH